MYQIRYRRTARAASLWYLLRCASVRASWACGSKLCGVLNSAVSWIMLDWDELHRYSLLHVAS